MKLDIQDLVKENQTNSTDQDIPQSPKCVLTQHRVSKGPKMVLSFGRRQKLSFLSQFFLSGHIYPITQEFA